jgi:hypothetical protein
MGRWPSRDPIGERGGLNTFAFVRNTPTLRTDFLGLEVAVSCCQQVIDKAVGRNWKARELIAAIRAERGCAYTPPVCRSDCGDRAGGYNTGTKRVEICSSRLGSNYEAETTLIHELVHAYDDCKGRLTANCEDVLCTEIRAWDIGGDCAEGGSEHSPLETYRDCIWRNATASALRATRSNGTSICSEATVRSMMGRMMARCLGTFPTDRE